MRGGEKMSIAKMKAREKVKRQEREKAEVIRRKIDKDKEKADAEAQALARKKAEEISKQPQQPKLKKIRHLFREDKVEQKKKEGWKVIGQDVNRATGVPADLVLMEKDA